MSLSHPSRDSQGRKERMSKERQEQAGVTRKLPRSGLVQLLFIRIPNIVRRAKLGVVSQGKNLAPEALAGHRVPSVASSSVTLAAKRTQGVHGRQCASVKGWSPVMRRIGGADVRRNTEGHIRGTNGHGPREPLGVEDRRTCIRQSRELGRSSGLLQGRG